MDTIVPQRAIIRRDGEGEQRWFAGGGVFTLKATAAETGGSLTVWEDRMARGKTTPLHQHPTFEETIYVLEGEILVHVDGVDHPVGANGLLVAPRGVPHAFLVTSETARILAVLTPAVGEGFYLELSEPVGSSDEVGRPPDWDRLRAVAAESDHIEILGPPPFELP
jgi:quercetin dioxygenase-like cupin family protein